MARPTDTRQAKSHYFRTRITPDEKALIDRMRGPLSESDWARRLIREEAERQGLAS